MVTDFSPCSAMAVPMARLLANSFGASLAVAHVTGPTQPGVMSEAEAQAQPRMEQFLAENSLSGAPAIIRQGSIPEVIEGVIHENGADLVVVGTHGRSGVGKLVMGSVAQRIFNAAPCPVLSVSPRGGTIRQPARILYATDFGERSLKALPYALSLAKVHDAELVLLHVPAVGAESGGYAEHLRKLVPQKARSWCRFDTVVYPGSAAEVILDVAQLQSADYIVIGAHAIEGPFYSINVPLTVAYRVVAHAQCPVLRVRS
jgi:nucleotide-binding universal stress UspA family protein